MLVLRNNKVRNELQFLIYGYEPTKNFCPDLAKHKIVNFEGPRNA